MSTIIIDDDEIAPPQLPDRYEVIDGEVVELPPMSGLASEISNRINSQLLRDPSAYAMGRSRVEMLFRIPLSEDRDRNRRPDVAFVSFDRWPDSHPIPYRGNPIDVVPELVVEVISPTDVAEDLLMKAFEYLRGGVKLVWLVFPRARAIQAYTSAAEPARIFHESDSLDAEPVIPGFRVSMKELFPTVTELPELE